MVYVYQGTKKPCSYLIFYQGLSWVYSGFLFGLRVLSIVSIFLGQKKNMCVYGHPTDPNFCYRPYEFLHRIRITIFVV